MRRTVLPSAVIAAAFALLPGCRDAKLKPEVDLEYQFALPENYDPEYEYPLVIAMHDAGSNEDYIFKAWDEDWFDRPDFIMLGVRAPFKAGEGFSWVKRTDQTEPAALYANLHASALTSAARMIRVVEEFEQEYAIDPDWIFLLGIRQAADIALFSSLRHPDYFTGAAAIRGDYDTTLLAPGNFDAIERLELFFGVPDKDSDEGKRAERLWEMLEPYQMDVKFHRQAGNRAYDKEALRAMQDFFGLVANEKGEEHWPEDKPFESESLEE